MRIVIDLDGTICELKRDGQAYADVAPIAGAVEALQSLKQAGHEIVIYTARNMKTQEGNVGRVVANIGQITMNWLASYRIPYDELVFGKPYGEVYIDDLAYSFDGWASALKRLNPAGDES